MKIYRANILFTPTPEAFKVLEHGYVVVGDDGNVVDTYQTLPEQYAHERVIDFGDRLLMPAMNVPRPASPSMIMYGGTSCVIFSVPPTIAIVPTRTN